MDKSTWTSITVKKIGEINLFSFKGRRFAPLESTCLLSRRKWELRFEVYRDGELLDVGQCVRVGERTCAIVVTGFLKAVPHERVAAFIDPSLFAVGDKLRINVAENTFHRFLNEKRKADRKERQQ